MTGEKTDSAALAAFIRANTQLATPPLVPEIRLHLADSPYGLWEKTSAELGPLGMSLPYWGFAWAGGQALARYVLDHPYLVAGHGVLDFASGAGLAAIAAARAGAGRVTASDIDPCAAVAIELNAAVNGVDVGVLLEDVLDGDGAGSAVVLAGDVFYEKAMAERVLPFLERARRRGARVLTGDPGRDYFPDGRLEPLATYDIPVTRALENTEMKRTTVWTLAPE